MPRTAVEPRQLMKMAVIARPNAGEAISQRVNSYSRWSTLKRVPSGWTPRIVRLATKRRGKFQLMSGTRQYLWQRVCPSQPQTKGGVEVSVPQVVEAG